MCKRTHATSNAVNPEIKNPDKRIICQFQLEHTFWRKREKEAETIVTQFVSERVQHEPSTLQRENQWGGKVRLWYATFPKIEDAHNEKHWSGSDLGPRIIIKRENADQL